MNNINSRKNKSDFNAMYILKESLSNYYVYKGTIVYASNAEQEWSRRRIFKKIINFLGTLNTYFLIPIYL